MDGDLNYFWCNEQYQFKSEILEEKGCAYSVYAWSEDYLHWKGEVRLVHEVADKCMYKERTFGHHNHFAWYLLKIVVIPVTLTAVCVRAMGRYFIIAKVEVNIGKVEAKQLEDFKQNGKLNVAKLLEHMEFDGQFLKTETGMNTEEMHEIFTLGNGAQWCYRYLAQEAMCQYLGEYAAPEGQTVDGFLWGAYENSGFINASDEELNSLCLNLLNKKSYKNLLRLLASYPFKCSVSPETMLKILQDPSFSEYKDKVINRLDHSDLLHLFKKRSGLELIKMTVDKEYDVYLFYAYEYGLDKEVINYLKSKLEGDLLDRWLNKKMKLHEEHLKELVNDNWIDQNGAKLNKEQFQALFKAGKIKLHRSQELNKRLVQWCAHLDPAIQEHIERNQLYAESETYVQSFKVALNVRPDTGTSKIGTDDFVVTDIEKLPNEWKKYVAPLKEIGRGTYSICALTRRIRRVGTVWKVSPVVAKDVDTTQTQYSKDAAREAEFLKEVFGKITDFTYLEKKLKVLNSTSIGKFYKSGDAGTVRHLRSDDPNELKFRAKILIDACHGAKELIDKYQYYHTDFKVQNIFYRVKKGLPKAVCGDFGILTRMIEGGIKYGTFEKEAEIAGDAKYQESRITYQAWVAAKFLFMGTRDLQTIAMLESLRQSQTLESSLKILQTYHDSI